MLYLLCSLICDLVLSYQKEYFLLLNMCLTFMIYADEVAYIVDLTIAYACFV